jgi:hypothetical protein
MERRPDKPLDNAQSNQLKRRLAQLATLGVFKSCKCCSIEKGIEADRATVWYISDTIVTIQHGGLLILK